MRLSFFRQLLLPLLLSWPLASAFAPSATATDRGLAGVQELLDLGQPEAALGELRRIVADGKPSAEALMLQSTARIMTGDTAGGFADLKQALDVDPSLRQGWLNLAGMEIAEGRYDEAYKALSQAEKLDPAAPDNHLNLGAVLVMQGKLEPATAHFAKYLAGDASAEARYLVASNYALGGYEGLAVEHLAEAVRRDERLRLRARSDDRFAALASPQYRQLLATDTYEPPPSALTTAAAFKVPYNRENPRLLYATLDALKALAEPYDPKVEATESWALIWGDLRIKVYNQANGTGVVSLSAPADRLSPDDWHRRTQALFRAIHANLERIDTLSLR